MINTIAELSKRDDEWRKIALKICRNKFLADDIVQDMYLRIYKQGKQWSEIKDSQEFYVYICIRNIFLNYIKKEKNEANISLQDIKEVSYEHDYDLKELNSLLMNEVHSLSFSQRESLELNIVDGKSMRWIANSRDISLNDVFRLCKTARNLLAVNFGKYYNEFKN